MYLPATCRDFAQIHALLSVIPNLNVTVSRFFYFLGDEDVHACDMQRFCTNSCTA
jgi:hypothetical protein